MKIRAIAVLALGIGLSGQVRAATAPPVPAADSAKGGAATKTAPAAGKASAPLTRVDLAPAKDGKKDVKKDAKKDAKKETKKDEPPPKIDGMEISRGSRGYLGIQIVGGTFKLNFYDAKKKPVAPDVARAALRWDPKYKVGMERVMLAGVSGTALTSERNVRPPYNFKLTITLLPAAAEGEDAPGETYVIDFRQ